MVVGALKSSLFDQTFLIFSLFIISWAHQLADRLFISASAILLTTNAPG
jgi:hypothetical protein